MKYSSFVCSRVDKSLEFFQYYYWFIIANKLVYTRIIFRAFEVVVIHGSSWIDACRAIDEQWTAESAPNVFGIHIRHIRDEHL